MRSFDDEFLRSSNTSTSSRSRSSPGACAPSGGEKTGTGVEFADHRDYAAGDDLRYLDWTVYQRFDKLLVRLYEEEEDLHIYILVDASALDAAPTRKLDHAKRMSRGARLRRPREPRPREHRAVRRRCDGQRLPQTRGKARSSRSSSFSRRSRPSGRTDLSRALESFVPRKAARPRRPRQRPLRSGGLRRGIEPPALSPFEPSVLQSGRPPRRGRSCAATSARRRRDAARSARSRSPSGSWPRSHARTPTIAAQARAASVPARGLPTIAPTSRCRSTSWCCACSAQAASCRDVRGGAVVDRRAGVGSRQPRRSSRSIC